MSLFYFSDENIFYNFLKYIYTFLHKIKKKIKYFITLNNK